ncbi:hypothetical protein ACPCZR_29985 [Bacillus bombysepticus]
MYRMHCENLKQLESAISLIQRDLRKYISMEQSHNEEIYTKILSYLVTCWTEVRILKLIHEQNAFTEGEIQIVMAANTLEQKWIYALNISICKAYGLQFTDNSNRIEQLLPFTPRVRYKEIRNLIANDLVPSITIRNRIAHGQWVYAFKNGLREVSTDLMRELRNENIVELQLRVKIFKNLTQIIHDLAVSPPTFERYFDENFQKLEQQKNNLHKRNYRIYKEKMVRKYQRGLDKRRERQTVE